MKGKIKEQFVVIVNGYVDFNGLRHLKDKEVAALDYSPTIEAIEHEIIVNDALYARVEKRYVLEDE